MPERFDQTLLDHIRYGRNNEAESMLNAELAQAAPVLVNDPQYRGTLLHFAAELNNAVIARRLIELGADVNRLQGCRRTPLTIAVDRQCTDVVQVLLEAGARVDITDEDGSSALQEGLDCNFVNSETFELLARKLRSEARTYDEVAETLIAAGCSLCHAASLRDINLLESMLKRGVNINSKDPTEMTALHAAAQLNDVNLAEWLLNNGVDVGATDDNGISALTMSVEDGTEAMMQFLTAHLAMLEMLGIPVDKSVMHSEDDRYRETMSELLKYYEQCQQVLAIKVFEKWSLLDLLIASERKMQFLAGKETFLQEVERFSSELKLSEFYSYYYNTMARRFAKPIRMAKLEVEAIWVVCEMFEANYNHFYVFAKGVVGYLDELDLENLVQASVQA